MVAPGAGTGSRDGNRMGALVGIQAMVLGAGTESGYRVGKQTWKQNRSNISESAKALRARTAVDIGVAASAKISRSAAEVITYNQLGAENAAGHIQSPILYTASS